jgi:F-type H+-transporting ATPase subunit b
VRYEGQVKQRQQRELAESVIAKVQKELENPKVLQQILQQSVADVESTYTHTRLVSGAVANHSPQRSSLPSPNKRLYRTIN